MSLSKLLSELIRVLLVYLHLNFAIKNTRMVSVILNVPEAERFAILSKLSSPFSIQNVFKPLLEILLGKGRLHDGKYSPLRVD
jgi:hypothetical protein